MRNEHTIGQQLALRVILRWSINAFALWISSLMISGVQFGGGLGPILTAALVLSLINAVLKPIVIILSLPAILLTLGLFTVVVNGLMVYLASILVSSFAISNILGAILAGMVVSLINYGLTAYLEERIFKR